MATAPVAAWLSLLLVWSVNSQSFLEANQSTTPFTSTTTASSSTSSSVTASSTSSTATQTTTSSRTTTTATSSASSKANQTTTLRTMTTTATSSTSSMTTSRTSTAVPVSADCAADSLRKCEQVGVIGKALGKEECAYRRDFYSCMLSDGCYDLPNACLGANQHPTSCRAACEAEPGVYSCVATDPAQDYNLCPHITKAMAGRPLPSADELASATPLPFTVALWTSFDRGLHGLYPDSVVPLFLPAVARYSLATVIGLYQAELIVEEPIAFRNLATSTTDFGRPPAWAQQTSFFVFTVLAVNDGTQDARRTQIVKALVAPAVNRSMLEAAVKRDFNFAIPQNGNLTLLEVRVSVITGRVDEFPQVTTSATTTTHTTTPDPAFVLRKWSAWRLVCVDPVVYRWEIFELQFFADGCPTRGGGHEPLAVRTTPAGDSKLGLLPRSSGSLSGVDGFDFSVFKTFDGVYRGLNASWVSSCRACAAEEAWVGLYADEALPFSAACVVIRQGLSPTGRCSRLALEVLPSTANISNESAFLRRGIYDTSGAVISLCVPYVHQDYPLLECGVIDDGCGGALDYGQCPGYGYDCAANRCSCSRRAKESDSRFVSFQCGAFSDGCEGVLDFGTCADAGFIAACVDHVCMEEDPQATRWRLVCASGLLGRWWVHELMFHSEALCEAESAQSGLAATISSGTFDSTHPMLHAFDGNSATFWASQCLSCTPGAAWLGVDFGVPVKVACVRLIQDIRTFQRCTQLVLQYSNDGVLWIERYRYGFGTHVIGVDEKLQVDTDVRVRDTTDLSPLHRSTLFWRIACATALKVQWGIYELNFYDDATCRKSVRQGIARYVQVAPSSYPVENAFDGKEHTLWKSKCGRCDGDSPCTKCARSEAYIGAVFSVPVNVMCIRVHQAELGMCPDIHLEFSMTGSEESWTTKSIFKDAPADAVLPATKGVGPESDRAWRRSSYFMTMGLAWFLILGT